MTRHLQPELVPLEDRVVPSSFSQASFSAPGFLEPTGGSGGPPAPSAAASPTRILSAVNGQLQVTDTSGGSQQAVSLSTFFSSATHGGPIFDPSVLYDPYAQRFWVIMAEGGPANPSASYIDIAVSTASGPTLNASDWHFYSVTASDSHTGTAFGADYPRAAADPTNLYISVNYLSAASPPVFEYAGVFRINKSLMINGQPLTLGVTEQEGFPANNAASLQPVQSYGRQPTDPQLFVDSNTANSGSIRVWELSPSSTSAVPILKATLSTPAANFTQFSPPGAPQGGSTYVDTMDARLTNAVYCNGAIWTAQTVNVNGFAAVKWFQINVPGVYGIVQSGTIAVANSYTYDPEVAVDAQGDLGITYTQSGASTYPQMMFTGRAATDPPGTLETPIVVKASSSYINEYNYTQGTETISKWGPWQGLAVAPSAPTFWALGEYANAPTQWGAAWGEFQFNPITQGLMLDNTAPHAPFSPPLNAALTVGPSSVVVTFNHQLQGFVPGTLTAGMVSNIYAVTVVPWGPDGVATAGDIPLDGTLNYSINSDGTSAITFTPTVPWSTDVYSIGVSGSLTDVSGNVLTTSSGLTGPEYSSFLVRYNPITQAAPAVTGVKVNNGAITVNNNVIPWFDALAITFNKAMDIQHVNSSYVQLLQKPSTSGTYTQVTGVTVAYNPGTLTAYLVPNVPLQATYGTSAIYLIVVSATLDDNTGYPNPGTHTLGMTYYNTFTLQSQSPPTNTSPLTILQQNGSDVSTPANGSLTGSTIGYGTVTMTEAVNPASLGPYSFTLIPRSGGTSSTQFDSADLPVNAVVTFNPNTNQLVIIPTVPLGSDVYLYTLTTPMKATNGDSLARPPLYESFQLSFSQAVSFVMVHPHAPASTPVAGGSPPAIAPATGTGGAVVHGDARSTSGRGRLPQDHHVRPRAVTARARDVALNRVAAALPTSVRTRRLGAWSTPD
ncbi:MAG: hypothetical protein P4L84_29205 [Isosphaeraceae bacterium]|nr:hypothetical protein [Isosphaeraceae bacterium]